MVLCSSSAVAAHLQILLERLISVLYKGFSSIRLQVCPSVVFSLMVYIIFTKTETSDHLM